MRNLLEKYYNINFYSSYKLQFFIFRRMLNLFYWLSFSKWKNGYINRCISTNKRHEAAGMDKGIDVYISDLALSTPCIISIWAFCLVCLACIKIFRISLLSSLRNDIIFISWLVVFGICGYYVNEIFLFKRDKYRKYFAEFDKKKRYLLYYGIYVVSLIIRLATFYLLLASAWGKTNWKVKNNYELYYSRKIGKSSYMGMEQVCEENCHSLQGNWLSLFGLGLSSDRYFAFWRT